MNDGQTNILNLKEMVRSFIEERDWAKYHNPKDIAISISIESSELLELFQWVEDTDVKHLTTDPKKREQMADELADIVIYCLSLSNSADIDLSQAITTKIKKNIAKYPIDKIKGKYKKYTEIGNEQNSDSPTDGIQKL